MKLTIKSLLSTVLRKSFILYFCSYMIVILIPTIFLSISSFKMVVNTLKDGMVQTNQASLRQFDASFANLMNEMTALAVKIKLDGKIFTFAKGYQDNYQLNEIRDRIQSLVNDNSNLYGIELYFHESSLIVSTAGLPHPYLEGSQEAAWIKPIASSGQDMIWINPRTVVSQDGTKTPIVTLAFKLSTSNEGVLGYGSISVSVDKMYAILHKLEEDPNRNIYILNSNRDVIVSHVQNTDISEVVRNEHIRLAAARQKDGSLFDLQHEPESLIAFNTVLPHGWALMSETSLVPLYRKLAYIRNVILLTGSVLVALGLIISYMLSRTMYNPLKKLIQKSKAYQQQLAFPMEHQDDNEFKFLGRFFDQMAGKHRMLEETYRHHYPTLVDRFLLELLNQKIAKPSEIRKKIHYLQLPLTLPYFMVLLIELDDYSQLQEKYSPGEMELLKFAVGNITEEIVGESYRCLCGTVNENQNVVLVNLDDTPGASAMTDIVKLANQLREAVRSYLKMSVTISIGTIYGDIASAYLSYKEAADVMRNKLIAGNNQVLVYEDIHRNRSANYYYPIQTERAILNLLKAGHVGDACRLLEQIQDEIIHKQDLSYENIYRIYDRLLTSTLDLILELNGSIAEVFVGSYPLHQDLAKKETVEAITQWMKGVFERVTVYLQSLNKNNGYIDKILEYIHARYHTDLSIDQLADQVNLNPAYLSRTFKQHTGKTILEYLTLLRIKESKALLTKTNDNLHDIAKAVGYNNTNSFIRFFKKYEGITPGEYRKGVQ